MNTVVLIDTDYFEARKTCERIEGEYIEDFDNHHDIQEVPPNKYEVYKLTDFMDLCNDQEIDLENYFITFVTT